MLVWQIILAVVAAILLFVVFLPVSVECRFANNFWQVRLRTLLFCKTLASSEKIDGGEDENEDEKAEIDGENFLWLAVAKTIWENERKVVFALLKFVGKTLKLTLKLFSPAKLDFNLSGGFIDPAETGWLSAIFIALNSLVRKNPKISINYAPDFREHKWKFDGKARFVFSVASILFFVLLLLIYVPWLHIIACLWRNRKQIFAKKHDEDDEDGEYKIEDENEESEAKNADKNE